MRHQSDFKIEVQSSPWGSLKTSYSNGCQLQHLKGEDMSEKAKILPNLNSNFKQTSVKTCGVLVSCWKSVKDSHQASLCMKNGAIAYCTNF